jgi:hypothetical protein
MRCTGCFKQFKEEEKAYATVVGSIERNPILNNDLGFYMDDIEPWLSVLCEDCGMALHNDFIAGTLQARYFSKTKKQTLGDKGNHKFGGKVKKESNNNESWISWILKDALIGDSSILDSIDAAGIQDVEARNFYLALKTELEKIVAERKKFLNKHFHLKPLSDNDASEVEKLLIERAKEKGYGGDAEHRARKLWQDFVKTANPHIIDSQPWVAALDFIIRKSAIDADRYVRFTQKSIAQEFGITFGRINRCYRNIGKSVDIDYYFSNFDNIETLHRLIKFIFKIQKKFRKPLNPIEEEMIKADEKWFDNIYEYASALRNKRNPRQMMKI